MSTKHIYFFNDEFDVSKIDYVLKKYDGLFVRKVEKCLMPAELSQYWAYTLDDFHVNIGIGNCVLSSQGFKEQWSFTYPQIKKSLIEKAEYNEKCTLRIKHILFDILLCCDIDTVGVAAMYQPGDVVSLDCRDFNVEYECIWNITVNTLADMKSDTTVFIIKK